MGLRQSGCRTVAISALAAFVAFPCLTRAAVISNINATWPFPTYTVPADQPAHATAISPGVDTLDAIGAGTHANRAINSTRIERQTFTVRSDLTIGSIYLSANNYGNQPFNISFFQVTAVNGTGAGGIGTPGAQVGSTITVPAFGSTASGDRNLEIDLDPSEQITLPGVTGTNGYCMQIQLPDSTVSTTAFNWVMLNDGTDTYPGGRYRRDDGDTTNTRDYGLALVAAPEPTTLAALAIGSVLTMRRRRPC
jgi:hypothetical protein